MSFLNCPQPLWLRKSSPHSWESRAIWITLQVSSDASVSNPYSQLPKKGTPTWTWFQQPRGRAGNKSGSERTHGLVQHGAWPWRRPCSEGPLLLCGFDHENANSLQGWDFLPNLGHAISPPGAGIGVISLQTFSSYSRDIRQAWSQHVDAGDMGMRHGELCGSHDCPAGALWPFSAQVGTHSPPPTAWRPFNKGRAAWNLLSAPDAYTCVLWGPLTTFPCNSSQGAGGRLGQGGPHSTWTGLLLCPYRLRVAVWTETTADVALGLLLERRGLQLESQHWHRSAGMPMVLGEAWRPCVLGPCSWAAPNTPCFVQFSSVQLLSHVQLFVTPWIAARQASLSITNSQSLLKVMSTESVMPFNHLILCHPSLPALNPSQHQGLFKWVSSSHQVAKVLEFQLQHQSFQGTPRTDLLYDGLVGSPCSPRASSSSTPQFKSIRVKSVYLQTPSVTGLHGSLREAWRGNSHQDNFLSSACYTVGEPRALDFLQCPVD